MDNDHHLSFENEWPVLDSVLDFSDAAQPDEMGYLSEGLINLPEDSVVNMESSDGHGYVYEPKEVSDGDHEKDEDYIMDDASDALDSDGDNGRVLDPYALIRNIAPVSPNHINCCQFFSSNN